MRCRMPIVALLVLVATVGHGSATFTASQPSPATWNSAMIWQPSLGEAGDALSELVNQIDASCSVDVDPVETANGAGPEGPVYGFAVTWRCPSDPAQQAPATWNSAMLWQPTLSEAGQAMSELVNQIEASCSVDVDTVMATNGAGPEGPVYAFVVTWACPSDAAQTTSGVWNSAMLWRPTLGEAGDAMSELVNQIDAPCAVDADPVTATNGTGPEGPVYAFVITWAC